MRERNLLVLIWVLLLLLLVVWAAAVTARPYVVSDPIADATHCAYIVDGGPVSADIPLAAGVCGIDITGLPVGTREVLVLGVSIGPGGRSVSALAGKVPVQIADGAEGRRWQGSQAIFCNAGMCSYEQVPVVVTPPPPPPTLANGGLEYPVLAGGTYVDRPLAAGWTFTGASGIQRNGSAWRSAPAPEGAQTAYLQNISAMSQNIELAAGSHTLTFKVARRAYASPSTQRQTIRITLDSVQIWIAAPALTTWSAVTVPFQAPGGVSLLRLEGLNAVGDATVFLDDVRVQ